MEITTTFIMMTKQTVIYRGNDTVNMHHQIFYLKRKEKETLRTNLKNYFFWGGGWLGVGGWGLSYILIFSVSISLNFI